MAIYIYQNPFSNEVIEVVQRMNEPHVYVDKDGVKWNRTFTKPQAAFNTQLSTTDSQSFVNKTRDKNYSIGQLWDMSAELSEKREGTSGQDEIRVKAENAYKEKTHGKRHPHAKVPKVFEV